MILCENSFMMDGGLPLRRLLSLGSKNRLKKIFRKAEFIRLAHGVPGSITWISTFNGQYFVCFSQKQSVLH